MQRRTKLSLNGRPPAGLRWVHYRRTCGSREHTDPGFRDQTQSCLPIEKDFFRVDVGDVPRSEPEFWPEHSQIESCATGCHSLALPPGKRYAYRRPAMEM